MTNCHLGYPICCKPSLNWTSKTFRLKQILIIFLFLVILERKIFTRKIQLPVYIYYYFRTQFRWMMSNCCCYSILYPSIDPYSRCYYNASTVNRCLRLLQESTMPKLVRYFQNFMEMFISISIIMHTYNDVIIKRDVESD